MCPDILLRPHKTFATSILWIIYIAHCLYLFPRLRFASSWCFLAHCYICFMHHGRHLLTSGIAYYIIVILAWTFASLNGADTLFWIWLRNKSNSTSWWTLGSMKSLVETENRAKRKWILDLHPSGWRKNDSGWMLILLHKWSFTFRGMNVFKMKFYSDNKICVLRNEYQLVNTGEQKVRENLQDQRKKKSQLWSNIFH